VVNGSRSQAAGDSSWAITYSGMNRATSSWWGELPTAGWGRLRAVPSARVAPSGPWRGNVARTQARYDEFAEWYEQWIGGAPPLIAAHAGLLPAVAGEQALDMACGQGRMSRHLARPGQMLSESTSRPRCSTRPAPQPNGLPGLGGGRLRPACWHDLHRGDGHHAGGLTGHRHALRAWSPRPGWTGALSSAHATGLAQRRRSAELGRRPAERAHPGFPAPAGPGQRPGSRARE